MRRREAVREKGLRRSLPKTNRFFDSYRYRYRDTATGFAGGSVCQNASQSLPHLRQIKSNLFCGGAHPRVASLVPLGQFTFCTRRKIQYRTQVCSLSALSGQRASPKGISFGHAQCPARDFVEKPNRFFDRLNRTGNRPIFYVRSFRVNSSFSSR